MLKRDLLFTFLIFGLCACAREAHLYPANDLATPSGVLTARYMSYGVGHGEVEIPMPDGEILKGEYSLVRGGEVGFGSIYGAVYGTGGATSVSGTSMSYAIPGGSPGTVSAPKAWSESPWSHQLPPISPIIPMTPARLPIAPFQMPSAAS